MLRTLVVTVCLLAQGLALPTRARPVFFGRGRVIGGSDVSISDYPYQASLLQDGSHFCGASIISGTWTLTAAHCVLGTSASRLGMRVGTTTRDSGGSVHSASSVTWHESYNFYTNDYDIAVVQTSDSFPLGANVQVVSLAAANYDPPGGLAATLTGWGSVQFNGGVVDTLQKVDLSVVDRQACQSYMDSTPLPPLEVTQRMVCAGVAGRAACQGDSGGPLVSAGTQVGVVSFGMYAACESSGTVFANVGNLRTWITSKTNV
ncbi:trypsin alpha-3-like [Schistocerca serialis cubense]|uniref:trypsin alpha-3-like n=1 Tax=Schistocerca serialis cubense TaxID=2023355 RepID=UPI00214F44AA|nr:trypsin alpha-3-like [Schistocerca serialis cubense]